MTAAKKHFVHFYFLLWCLYYLQGTFGISETMSQALLGIVLIMSAFHFFRAHLMGMSKQLRWLDILVIMFIIYGIVGIISGNVINVGGMTNVVYIKNIVISFLPIYSFYYYTQKGDVYSSRLFAWTIALLVVYILSFINHRIEGNNNLMLAALNNIDEGTNNAGYLVVSLIPLLIYLNKHSIIQYSVLALIMLFTISSMKRGAIIVGAFMMIVLILSSIKKSKTGHNVVILILLVVVVFVGVRYIEYILTTSDFFNLRLQMTLEGDTSTRDDIYSFFFHYFLNQTSIISFLVGSGANATAQISGLFAHNDWLEIAIDQGILGVCVYLAYWISLIKSWRTTSFDKSVFLSFGLTLLYMFFRTLVSMSFLMIPLSCTIVLGYGLAKSSTTKNNLRVK